MELEKGKLARYLGFVYQASRDGGRGHRDWDDFWRGMHRNHPVQHSQPSNLSKCSPSFPSGILPAFWEAPRQFGSWFAICLIYVVCAECFGAQGLFKEFPG